ncbi:MAG: HupE/UreJ family protein [Leptothrix sp. (in: b-proteobacteria)]
MPTTALLRRLGALCLAGLLANTAQAHKASDAYLTLVVDAARITQRFDIALRDLDRDLALDQDDDGQLRWSEVRTRWPQIEALADASLQLRADGQPCRSSPPGPAQLDQHSDGAYAVLTRSWQCDAPVKSLDLQYRLFAGSDPTHRGILRIDQAGATPDAPARTLQTAVLVPQPDSGPAADPAGATAQHFVIAEPGAAGPRSASLTGFIAEGVHHILIGTDHVLFLFALLLPAVLLLQPSAQRLDSGGRRGGHTSTMQLLSTFMRRHDTPAPTLTAPGVSSGGGVGALALPLAQPGAGRALAPFLQLGHWQDAPTFGPVLCEVVRVVSAFTLAHSITLALAVLNWVNPPSRAVESIIAASVIFAALNNIRPMLREQRWRMTFVFGLVHGFGFASALKDLGLDGANLATSLLGFNLGVELGQLALVSLFLPLAWAARRSQLYQRGVLIGGSGLIAVLASIWLIERVFDLKLLAL